MPTAYARQFAAENADRFVQELADLLHIPSISTLPQHAPDVQLAAEWIVADMQRSGFTRAEIFQEAGFLPLVYGEWLGAGPAAPTVLVYTHYDVQPAEVADGWQTDPFQPTQQDGKLYARGAVDSKSHVVIHLKAAEALLAAAAQGSPPPVNIKLLFEGEEESGSEHIFRFIQHNPDLLHADVCLISDGSFPDPNQPVISYGLRGIITMELTVTGPRQDLHSGHYGGSVHNPIQALAAMLAQFHDADGHVLVPGFYDAVRPLLPEERARLAPFGEYMAAEWARHAAAPAHWGEPNFALHERAAVRPTLEINGIGGGFYGQGFKTVLPAKAGAKLSCRLVPDQDPARIFALVRDYSMQITPPSVTSELALLEDGAPGVLLDLDTPGMQAVAAAYEQGWGVPPVFAREGGSVPVVSAFQTHLDAQIVPLPFGYRGGGAHGPNEYVILEMFQKGILTTLHFYEALARLHRPQ